VVPQHQPQPAEKALKFHSGFCEGTGDENAPQCCF
jgi:hypothetical protein